MSPETIMVRDCECGGCESCGANLSQSEHEITIAAAVAAMHADPGLIEPLLVRACRRCGARYNWDVAITVGELDEPWADVDARQSAVLATVREQVERGTEPATVAALIRRELGVVGIWVEDGSEADRRLWAWRPGRRRFES